MKFEYLTTGECISQSFHDNVDVVLWSVELIERTKTRTA